MNDLSSFRKSYEKSTLSDSLKNKHLLQFLMNGLMMQSMMI